MHLINVNLERWGGGGGGRKGQAKPEDLNSKQFFGSSALSQSHPNNDQKRTNASPLQLRLEVKIDVFHQKQQHTLTKMLRQNASIAKECFPPTQFNEFAAVVNKQKHFVSCSHTE